MIANPHIGMTVQIWYAKKRAHWPLHGKIGVVVVASRGPGPRNHGVMVDGELTVVPCGNLRKGANATDPN